jgi:hypothetical protein
VVWCLERKGVYTFNEKEKGLSHSIALHFTAFIGVRRGNLLGSGQVWVGLGWWYPP